MRKTEEINYIIRKQLKVHKIIEKIVLNTIGTKIELFSAIRKT